MKIRALKYVLVAFAMVVTSSAVAASAEKIDREANKALEVFKEQIDGSEVFLNQAAGYLVFPRVIKVGIGVGAETGEGALRVGGQSVAYYRTTSGSVGLQLGAQAKSIVIAFMTRKALDDFRNSEGWKVGVDGSVALIDIGAGKTIDSQNITDPVVGFIRRDGANQHHVSSFRPQINLADKISPYHVSIKNFGSLEQSNFDPRSNDWYINS